MKMFCVTNGKIGLCGHFVFWLCSTYGLRRDDCLKVIQEYWEKLTVEERVERMLLDCHVHK